MIKEYENVKYKRNHICPVCDGYIKYDVWIDEEEFIDEEAIIVVGFNCETCGALGNTVLEDTVGWYVAYSEEEIRKRKLEKINKMIWK